MSGVESLLEATPSPAAPSEPAQPTPVGVEGSAVIIPSEGRDGELGTPLTAGQQWRATQRWLMLAPWSSPNCLSSFALRSGDLYLCRPSGFSPRSHWP